MPTHRELAEAAKLGETAEQRLARNLYRRKAREYRSTLLALGRKHGLQRQRVQLSAEIREALEAEAAAHARSSVDTYNGYVEDFVERERRRGRSLRQVRADLPAYMRARKKGRLSAIDHSATTTARLDAQVAFYLENGVDPHFKFEGPVTSGTCALCKALLAAHSHPIEVVLSIGIPHIGCAHRWRGIEISAAELRRGGVKEGEITLGRGSPQGIVGGDVLEMRLGGINAAADYVRDHSEPELIEQFTDGQGRVAALSRESSEHIVRRRSWSVRFIPTVIEAIKDPDAMRTATTDPRIEAVWIEGVGPSKWLRATVKYVAGDRGYLTSIRGNRKGPGSNRL